MKRATVQKLVSLFMASLLLMLMSVTGCTDIISFPHAHAVAAVPAAFSLAGSRLGDEHTSGVWRYAIRETDGYAVVTGYNGSETAVTVPWQLDGSDVVGLASGALTEQAHITLHSNILFLDEQAFGDSKPEIIAPNGSYGLYFASIHELNYTTGKSYDLVPGVLDLTDALPGRIQKRGDQYVFFQPLEGCRLQVGSLFFMRSSRNMDYYFEVISLTEQNHAILAEVRIPEASDFFINYETELEVALTEADFYPAEGTELIPSGSSDKSVYQSSNSDTVSFTAKLSKNDFSGSITVSSTNTVSYKVTIHDGVTTATEMTKSQAYKVKLTGSCSKTGSLLKTADDAEKKISDKSSNGSLTPSELKKIAQQYQFSYPFWGDLNASTGVSTTDIDKAFKEIKKLKENALNGSSVGLDASLGKFFVQLPFCMVDFDISFDITVSGSINITYTNTNVSKEHYDTLRKEWVVDYTRGNSSTDKNSFDFVMEGKAELELNVEISVGFTLVKVFSGKLGIGLEISFSFPVASVEIDPGAFEEGTQRFIISHKCGTFTVDPYMSFKVYAGFWLGKQTGAKIEIYNKKWNVSSLIGKEHLVEFHFNPWLDYGKIHTPDACTELSDVKVKYNTKTMLLLSDRPIQKGGKLTEKYNLILNDDPFYGKFLGWAFSCNDSEPTAFDNRPGYPVLNPNADYTVNSDLTLYAIWENQLVVHFDTNGGSNVADQYVPRGGYAKEPSVPTRPGYEFAGWVDATQTEWNFNQSIVMTDTVLTAQWEAGEATAGGTNRYLYIGMLSDVSSDCLINTESLNLYGSIDNFQYTVIDGFDNQKAIRITGINNNPVHLVIPKQLPDTSMGDDSMLNVADIASNAFRNCTSLRSIHFLTDSMTDSITVQFDTESWFTGCTNLEYVELPALENGAIGAYCFDGCSSLKCVKVRPGLKSIGAYAFRGTPIRALFLNAEGVGRIDPYAFYDTDLQAVTLPQSLTSIGACAFYGCTNAIISGISLPNLTYLGDCAFDECHGLNGTVYLPSLNEIGSAAFRCTKISKAVFSSALTTVGGSAFNECDALTSVDLGGNVEVIGSYAFAYCTALKSVDLGENLIKIGGGVFDCCSALEELVLPDSLQEITGDYKCIATLCSRLRKLTIGGLSEIDEGLFLNCYDSLEILTIRGSVKTISSTFKNIKSDTPRLQVILEEGVENLYSAFTDSTAIVSVTLPQSLTSIGYCTFYWCTNAIINGISLPNLTYLGSGAFEGCYGLSGTVYLPSLNEIGSSAFCYTKISKAVFSSALTTVGGGAFYECDALTSVDLGGNVESFGTYVFSGCTALKSVDLGERLKKIGYGTFDDCKALEELVLPDSLREINVDGIWAESQHIAQNCTNLRKLTIGGLSEIDEGLFLNCYDSLEILTIRGSVKTINSTFKNIKSDTPRLQVILEEGVENLYSAFRDSTAIVSVTLPQSLTTIGYDTFYGCTNAIISGISLPNLTYLGSGAFEGCYGLSGTVYLPSLNEIGGSAFCCTKISKAVFSSALTTVGGFAFDECDALTSVDLGGNVEVIGLYAFAYCTALKSVDLGENLIKIGGGVFHCCSALEELVLPDSLQEITGNDKCIATLCSRLRKLTIGGLEEINSSVFSDCNALEILTIRGGVKRINSAFKDIKSDTPHLQVILEEGVENLYRAFSYNTAIVSITIPQSLSFFDNNTFSGCSNLRDVKMNSSTLTEFYRTSEHMKIHFAVENEALASWCDSNDVAYDTDVQIEHSVTLDTRGGTLPNRAATVLISSWLEALNLPVPVREGYVFGGWSLSENETVIWTGSAMLPYDVTLYAVWLDPALEQKYTLTLVFNGGSAEQTVYELVQEDAIDVNMPTREGYVFVGWSLYEQGEPLYTGTMPAEDTTLYASWKQVSSHGVYQYYADHAVLTSYYLLEEEGDTVVLPETVQGLPLTAVADRAFDGIGVKTVYLPSTVTSVTASSFFGCETLEAISVSAANEVYRSISGILYNKDGTRLIAFPPAGSIYVHVPEGVTEIGENAFADTKIRSVMLPDSLHIIGGRAFKNTSLSSLILPPDIQSIGEYAFSNCKNLQYIETQSNPETVSSTAFSNCSTLLTVYGPNEDCPLRQAVRASHAYYNPYMLTMVTDRGTQYKVLQAGEDMDLTDEPPMNENRRFTGWYLEETLETIWTESLMPAHDLVLYAGGQEILYYDTLTDSNGTAALTITGCISLEHEITIPETIGGIPVVSISAAAFSAVHEQIHIPASVTTISEGAFAEDTVLICEPESFAWIWARENGFSTVESTWTLSWETGYELTIEPVSLQSGAVITMPTLIRSGYTFVGWSWTENSYETLTDAAMPANDAILYAVWTVADQELAELVESFTWIFTETTAAVSAYNGTAAILTVPDTVHGLPVTSIERGAFAYQDTVIQLTLPDSVTFIGTQAFFSMHDLKTVYLPSGLTDIPAGAFGDCIRLTNLTLPEGLQTIGEKAFENTALRRITLPASLTLIHATALKNCSQLAEVTVLQGNTCYESRDGVLFDTADGVLVRYPAAKEGTSYTVSNTWSVGDWAFEGASNLQEIILTEDVYSWGEGAFAGTGLCNMPTPGPMITRIPASCFRGCTDMLTTAITDTIGQIGSMAFSGTAFGEVILPDSIVQIGSDAFDSDVIIIGSDTGYSKEWAAENGYHFMTAGSQPIESIAFGCESLTIKRGEQVALSVIVTPQEASVSGLYFTAMDTSVVQIDQSGVVTAISGGKTIVVVSAPGNITAACPVTVEVDTEALTLNLEPVFLTVGESGNLEFSFYPLMVTDKTLTFEFGAAVYIDESGHVTAIREGSAVIKATTVNGVSDEITVTVSNPAKTLALPAALDSIEAEAFSGINAALVIIPDGTDSIGSSAFAGCSSLTGIIIPQSVHSIAANAFDGCGDFVIITPSNSEAASYARTHQIRFVPSDIRSTDVQESEQ